jgi:hypothetical protein
MSYSWQVIDSISPVFSDWGFKNWDLCLAKDGIVAVPRRFWLTIRAGAWAGLGNPGAMQRSWSSETAPQGPTTLEDKDCMTWRRYPIQDIESIVVQRRLITASEIRIKKRGQEEQIYGGGDFREIMRSRLILSQLYPGLYSERGRWPKKLY